MNQMEHLLSGKKKKIVSTTLDAVKPDYLGNYVTPEWDVLDGVVREAHGDDIQ